MSKFNATFDSLYKAKCPDWFRDAKFGIWSHWGPQSVPMYGDWYARHMYMQGTPQYLYHVRHYGHPSKFGYKDLCALWKAENFDPEGLMDLYYKAGARYFVGQAMHHDHFFNYPSKLNRFNSTLVGPKKDICGMWKKAAEKYNMPFGLAEHLGATFSWWRVNKMCDTHGPYKDVPYDGNDPEYLDFYLDNNEDVPDFADTKPWYTENVKFRDYWLKVVKEVIDMFEPDLLYTDGALPFGTGPLWFDDVDSVCDSEYRWGLDAVSYLYNKSASKYGENRAVYVQKDRNPKVYRVGLLDIEKSQLPDIADEPWQTDTCIGNWFYDVRQTFKTADHIVEMLVDIISKNGTMLMNMLQLPDGTVDDETKYLLASLAEWFAVCSEGVYGTRPWKVASEGLTKVLIDGFCEEKTNWNESDYRFVIKENIVYTFMLGNPCTAAVIRSFNEGESIKNVRMLGFGNLEFKHNYGILNVKLPDKMPAPYVNCLAVELN